MTNSILPLLLAGWIVGALVTLAAIFSVRMVSFMADPDAHARGTARWVAPALLLVAALWPLLAIVAIVEPILMVRAARRLPPA